VKVTVKNISRSSDLMPVIKMRPKKQGMNESKFQYKKNHQNYCFKQPFDVFKLKD